MNSIEPNYQLFNQNCNSKFLLLCDHATNRIPEPISKNQLGLTKAQLDQHIAFDIGAKGTAIELSKNLTAPLITSNFSRLVIDPNRSPEDPTSIMQIYDGAIIRGNLDLSKAQLTYRRKNYYDAYHREISNFINNKRKERLAPCLVSIHSFTPQLQLGATRPWHIGVLWDKDRRFSDLVINELTKYKEICVGKNKPYTGNLKGDTLSKHGTSNNLLHVLIEIRNDLISDIVGQKKWAKIIELALKKSIKNIEE